MAATGQPQLIETLVTKNKITCKSRPKAAIEINGRVVKRMKAGQLDVAHRFAYKWTLHGSKCHRVDRGRWTLLPPNDPTKKDNEESIVNCQKPGPVHALKRRGVAAFGMDAGEAANLRLDATDKNGCSVPVRVRWSTTRGRIDRKGRLDTRGLKAGPLKVTGKVGKLSRVFEITILQAKNDDGLVPKHSPFDPTSAIQLEDQAVQHGIVVTAKVGPSTADPGANNAIILAASGFALGFICLIVGLRKRRARRLL